MYRHMTLVVGKVTKTPRNFHHAQYRDSRREEYV
jgi:hypothetical protein